MPKISIYNKEGNLLNNSSTIRNPSTKLKYFNIEKKILLISDYSPFKIND